MNPSEPLFGPYQPYYQSEIFDPDNPPKLSKKGRMIIQQGAAPNEYVAIFREAAAQFQQRKWFTATAPNDITCNRHFYDSFREFLEFYNADVNDNPTNLDSPKSDSKVEPHKPDPTLKQRRSVMIIGRKKD
ncbi:MAG TPA: hypothetical protein VLE89_01835 [Chlamydiales bacterium]|nr:hypothetical protein [Chlamydiales bacterium]